MLLDWEVEACDCFQLKWGKKKKKKPATSHHTFSWYISQFFPSLEMHSIIPSFSAACVLSLFPPFFYLSLSYSSNCFLFLHLPSCHSVSTIPFISMLTSSSISLFAFLRPGFPTSHPSITTFTGRFTRNACIPAHLCR